MMGIVLYACFVALATTTTTPDATHNKPTFRRHRKKEANAAPPMSPNDAAPSDDEHEPPHSPSSSSSLPNDDADANDMTDVIDDMKDDSLWCSERLPSFQDPFERTARRHPSSLMLEAASSSHESLYFDDGQPEEKPSPVGAETYNNNNNNIDNIDNIDKMREPHRHEEDLNVTELPPARQSPEPLQQPRRPRRRWKRRRFRPYDWSQHVAYDWSRLWRSEPTGSAAWNAALRRQFVRRAADHHSTTTAALSSSSVPQLSSIECLDRVQRHVRLTTILPPPTSRLHGVLLGPPSSGVSSSSSNCRDEDAWLRDTGLADLYRFLVAQETVEERYTRPRRDLRFTDVERLQERLRRTENTHTVLEREEGRVRSVSAHRVAPALFSVNDEEAAARRLTLEIGKLRGFFSDDDLS